MSDLTGYNQDVPDDSATAAPEPGGEAPEAKQSVLAQVSKILDTIKGDKAFHKAAFKRMDNSMYMAFHGHDRTWGDTKYTANFAGRHVRRKTDALYAKNPKATATRNERMDFTVWDENPQSLTMAFQITQQAQMALTAAAQQTAATPPDPITGIQVPVQPQMPQGFEQAQQIIADFQQGTAYRQMVDKVGRTLEILFSRSLKDQEPLDFKMAAKALVRRACTCCVGYIELGFVRELGPSPDIDTQLADARVRLDHLRTLTQDAIAGDIDDTSAEMAELEGGMAALTAQPEIVLREGLIFDFPQATKVIPDKLTRQLVGFVGARHIAIEYLFTCEQIREMFPEADVEKGGYKGYGPDGKTLDGPDQQQIPFDDENDDYAGRTDDKGKGLVCVWKYYDKLTGLVYYVADGHKEFLREPAPPDVFVEKFWPVFALTFNAVESETDLFPKSDVELLWDQQMEHNRSRQGMREHRQAARPRWVTSKGLIDDDGKDAFKNANPFDVIELNKDPATKVADLIESVPVPGVDPNLYATEQFDEDRALTVGTSESSYGGISKATATESSIAASATLSSDDSSKDDLDSFLSQVSRAASQILFKEMSEEQVKQIVGPGAVWPQQTLAQIANEMYLEVEAGSTGRPNQAVEIDNFTKLAPILFQIPGMSPVWMAKQAIRRLDDRLDVNEGLEENAPSIVAQNANKQVAGPTPAADPNAQGPAGANNALAPPQQESPGSPAAFGSNQT